MNKQPLYGYATMAISLTEGEPARELIGSIVEESRKILGKAHGKRNVVNVELVGDWDEMELLCTMAGVEISDEDYSAILEKTRELVTLKHGAELIDSITLEGCEGEWGDPADLM